MKKVISYDMIMSFLVHMSQDSGGQGTFVIVIRFIACPDLAEMVFPAVLI